MPIERADVESALLSKGFRREQKRRDHDFFFLVAEGRTKPVFTKLSRGTAYATLGDKLVGLISKQLHLTRQEFTLLVECPMTASDYLLTLTGRGVLTPRRSAPAKPAKSKRKGRK